jgi:hypothetical protein
MPTIDANGYRDLTAVSALEFLAGPLSLVERIVIIRVDFSEDRCVSIGRQSGLLRQRCERSVGGDILPNQYTALRLCGFDGVAIP